MLFSFRIRSAGKSIPLLVVTLGIVFNIVNTYLNARWISHLGCYGVNWMTRPLFSIRILVFTIGFALNVHSDPVLIRLRESGEKGYKIPLQGVYRWVSSPNYLGELLKWTGWTLATCSFSGLAFLFYSAANLVPRAISNHRWYKNKFVEYPSNRKCLIPYLF